MENQRVTAIRVDQSIFGAATQAGYASAGQALPEVDRQRTPQIGPPNLHGRDALALQYVAKAADGGFHFGKLWHLGDMAKGAQAR
jgi:hypothetical protein